LKGGALNSKL
jgi:hypothetical protein